MEKTKQSTPLTALTVGLKLLLICAIIAGVVAFVFTLTKDTADANRQKQKEEKIGLIFGVTDGSLSVQELKKEADGTVIIAVFGADKKLRGYCVEVTEDSGYNGDVKIIVGYAPDLSVCGVEIAEHAETPGLGAKITEQDFLKQFLGKNEFGAYEDEVDGIASATYSSKAVHAGIKRATEALNDLILKTGGGES